MTSSTKKYVVGILLFLAVFGFYLCSIAPSVAPYRDAGEMSTLAPMLGIAHPPGYPLYLLCGNAANKLIPFGNTAYRINILSAAAMAGSAALMFSIITALITSAGVVLPGIFSLLLATAGGFWYVSQVSEMYTVNVFACIMLLWLMVKHNKAQIKERNIYCAGLLAGIFLGFRMDLMLIFPALAIPVFLYLYKRQERVIPVIVVTGSFFTVGLSVYFYLYFRSRIDPLINWGSPDTLEKLFNVLSRKTHGHTLDLLSTNYATGAMFFPEMWIYAKHIFWEFTPFGIPFFLVGAYLWYKKNKIFFIVCLTGFVITGPIFIFLGNMPPNPHALAIMEPHYLLPDIFLFCFASGALLWRSASFIRVKTVFIICLVVVNCLYFKPRFNMRNNFFAMDYMKNILRCLPEKAIGIVKEDVQLFSMWYKQLVLKHRTSAPFIAQGLSGSPWYQKNMKRRYPGVHINRLKSPKGWLQLAQLNPAYSIYFTGDCEFRPSQEIQSTAYGLLSIMYEIDQEGKPLIEVPSAEKAEMLLNEMIVKRGTYEYEYQLYKNMNFFNADLIEDYSGAWRKLGFRYLRDSKFTKAEECFLRAINMKKIIPSVYYHLGYLYFTQEQFEKADKIYAYAEKRYEHYLRLTEKYHTLPGVIENIKKEFSEVCLHRGVSREKLGFAQDALLYFKKAIEIRPSFAQAYFNVATIYWKKKEWATVVYYMERAVYYDSKNMKMRQYLVQARSRIEKAGKQ